MAIKGTKAVHEPTLFRDIYQSNLQSFINLMQTFIDFIYRHLLISSIDIY